MNVALGRCPECHQQALGLADGTTYVYDRYLTRFSPLRNNVGLLEITPFSVSHGDLAQDLSQGLGDTLLLEQLGLYHLARTKPLKDGSEGRPGDRHANIDVNFGHLTLR